MNVHALSLELMQLEIHRQALNGYVGTYSMGVSCDAGREDAAFLLLQVPQGTTASFPATVNVKGEQVPLRVQRNLGTPVAQNDSNACAEAC